MKLPEYKAKKILQKYGIRIPKPYLLKNKPYINKLHHLKKFYEFYTEEQPIILKAQIIAGKRGKNGLIQKPTDYKDAIKKIEELYTKTYAEQKIETILAEKMIDIKEEYYLCITYDTKTRSPVLLLNKTGGINIEENSQKIVKYEISILEGLEEYEIREIVKKARFEGRDILTITDTIKKMWKIFTDKHCTTIEINPLIKATNDLIYAGDAKITIDDSAIPLLEEYNNLTTKEETTYLTEIERQARKIDAEDHRGVAGSTFMELNGNIAVLASGGGASLTAMDAIIRAGGKPANYTEYSGNPPREKVKKLTEITLSKPNLKGCIVIGGKAVFTDIYETLMGFMDAIKEIKPKYPIIIRRAGYRDQEAFEEIKKIAKENQLNITIYGTEKPISEAGKEIAEKVEQEEKKWE